MFCCTGTECSVVPVQNVLLYYCSTECSFVQVQSVLLYRYIMFCCTGTECFVVQVQSGLLYRYRMFCCTGTECFICTGTECSVVPVQNVLLYRYSLDCCTGTECYVVLVQTGLFLFIFLKCLSVIRTLLKFLQYIVSGLPTKPWNTDTLGQSIAEKGNTFLKFISTKP